MTDINPPAEPSLPHGKYAIVPQRLLPAPDPVRVHEVENDEDDERPF